MPAKLALALALSLLAAGVVQHLLRALRRSNMAAAADLPRWGVALVAVLVAVAVLGLIELRPLGSLLLVRSCWVAALGVIAVVDLRTRYILDACTAPLAVLAMLAAAVVGHPSLTQALLGGGIGLGVFGAVYVGGWLLMQREALGPGDVKLATLLGLLLGPGDVLTALAMGIVMAGGVALALVFTRRWHTRGHSMAYGPWLCLGGYLALLQLAGAA